MKSVSTIRAGWTGMALFLACSGLSHVARYSVVSEVGLREAKVPPGKKKAKPLSLVPLDRPPKVLVAEDDVINQKVMTRILQGLGST